MSEEIKLGMLLPAIEFGTSYACEDFARYQLRKALAARRMTALTEPVLEFSREAYPSRDLIAVTISVQAEPAWSGYRLVVVPWRLS